MHQLSGLVRCLEATSQARCQAHQIVRCRSVLMIFFIFLHLYCTVTLGLYQFSRKKLAFHNHNKTRGKYYISMHIDVSATTRMI